MEKSTITLSIDKLVQLQQAARLLEQASLLLREISQPDRFEYVPEMPADVPADQRWFWMNAWQAGEREVDEALKRGEYTDFESVDDLVQALPQQL